MTAPVSADLEQIAARARAAGVFGLVTVAPGRVQCAAKAAAAPAWYRVEAQGGGLHVSLVTPDRWLSHSIEADLLNTGDKMEELLEEELAELGVDASGTTVDHFRDEDKLFAFRTSVPTGGDAAAWLLAYEACFRRLGDMDAGEAE